ncbi:G-protein coupled receptor [Biomphalaria glabrata]|nr:G-protein coupled receptor [Biomphalaria glabrata]
MSNVTQTTGPGMTTLANSSLFDYYFCTDKADSAEQLQFIYVMMCFFLPGLFLVGFVANMISLVILKRNGLHKPSNILLFGLVVADNISLLVQINYAKILTFYGPNKLFPALCGFQYDKNVNDFLAISFAVFNTISMWGRFTSTCLPVLITLERLYAIFRPLTFKAVVTVKKTAIAVICSYLFWLPWVLAISAFYKISTRKLTENVSRTVLKFTSLEVIEILDRIQVYFLEPLHSWVPISFITTGCVIIWIKVKVTLRRRRNLTSSQNKLSWSPRTTRTLVLTCLVFSLTRGADALCFALIPVDVPVLGYLVNQIGFFLYAINASSNLFVYILSNKKFLNIFKAMMHISRNGSQI